MGIDPSNVVLISEYCGGGFGSKGAGSVTMAIPALLSKKANAPVMMRVSREEESYGAVLNAIAAAIGVDAFRRAPVTSDIVLTLLTYGRRMHEPFQAHL